MKKSCCGLKCGLITSAVIGVILVIIGGIIVTVFGILFDQIVVQEGTIAVGTTMYDAWSVVTTPTFMSYYFYNVTNAAEFLAQTPGNYVPPALEELGPYTFREYLAKDNIEFLSDLDPEEVFYRQTTTLIFDPENSKGSLDDQITTLNLIAASVAPIVDFQFERLRNETPGRPIYRQINKLYNDANTELLFTHTAHDILFGFKDPLYDSLVNLFAGLNITIPPTFGLFATSNTSAGWFDYQVYTGNKGHPELINLITRYKNMTELDYWSTEECNMINGTDGTTTPPFMEKEDKVYFFVDDVCRSLYATFNEEVTVKKVPAWKYSVPPEVFQSPIRNPDNQCFCPSPDEPLCQHDGGLSIRSCMAGAPAFVSSPHFLYGDGYYLNMTTGVSPPVPEEHEAALVYEPNSGTVIKVDKRLQINMVLRQNKQIDVLNQIEETIVFPVVWLNESGLVGDSDANLLYSLLVVPEEVVFILQIVFCVVGAILLLAPLCYVVIANYGKSSKVERNTSYKVNAQRPTVTRFSSSDNEVFQGENGKPPVYEYTNGVNGSRFISTTSTSELIDDKR